MSSPGAGGDWEVGSGWRRCARLQKGLPDGQGRRAAPPDQIGRKKPFEAGRYRLTGTADGLVCVAQSEDGEFAPQFEWCMAFMKTCVAVEGMAALRADVLGRFGL